MNPKRVYLDTVITSGRVLADLRPPAEMEAVDQIYRFGAEGLIEIVKSKMSRIEHERTVDPAKRAMLIEQSNEESVVQKDHLLLGFSSLDYGRRGFISSPIISDIVDEGLFVKLKATGLMDADARHVMYAVANDCAVFVTLDSKDILPRRSAVEAVCPQIRILKPSDLVAEMTTVPPV
jgi:hypothetical protein